MVNRRVIKRKLQYRRGKSAITKDWFRCIMCLYEIRHMVSLNLLGRWSLAVFHERSASLALKQQLNSLRIAVKNIGQWKKFWSSNFDWLSRQVWLKNPLSIKIMIDRLVVLTKYVPEVSVMHIGRTLLENIRCKRQVGEVSSHMIKFRQLV